MKRRRIPRVALALALCSGLALLPVASQAASSSASATTKSRVVERDNLDGGTDHVTDKRTVSVSVDRTTDLRGRDEISVSWSGAHPTGGIYSDQNAATAADEEYPMVLLECRGVDSTSVPASDQIRPQTCWTQSWSERFGGSNNDAFQPWRVDRYETTANRAAVVGAPAKRPAACYGAERTERWVPFVAADGTTYYGGPNACAGMPPEANDAGGTLDLPSNETFGVTQPNGTGTARFDVLTDAENASLGCSSTVPCSLVAIPIVGISCDADAADLPAADQPPADDLDAVRSRCEATGAYAPGSLISASDAGSEDVAVSGQLWWSASNWRNRITVPLTFAPASDVCDIIGGGPVLDVYGSELMSQATDQWAPAFCLERKSFRFKHIATAEPSARNLLNTGSIEAALTSNPPAAGYTRPVVNAPVGLTGFAISYSIDDAQHHEYTHLKLTPLLLAKLLTESYPSALPVKDSYPALEGNPLNITDDPEFIKLNPGITQGVGASAAASALLALSDQSDVMYALTSYINADPAARSWLDGNPDQWGMVVNPNYRNIALPVSSWPLRDTFVPSAWYSENRNNNECLYDSPVPYLPLVASPLTSLADIAQSVQFGLAQSQTVCSQPVDGSSAGEKLVALGRESIGYRFIIGVTTLADAKRYDLDTAALQTEATTTRTFVGPSDSSLRSAVALLTPDDTNGTWSFPYDELHTASGAKAYPGTQVVYASVPTSGLDKSDATDYALLLRFAAGPGQTPGDGTGQLPDGYLPLTKANGLGALDAYTLKAADAVAAQDGGVPAPSASDPGSKANGSGSSGGGTTVGVSGATPSSSPGPGASVPGASPAGEGLTAAGVTRSPGGGAAGLVLPVALALALLAGVLAPLTRAAGRRRAMR